MPPISVIKETGITMNQLIDKYKKDHNVNKVCFCGRLDPMARGKVLLLVGDECKNMPLYNKSNKTYQFEILFGISTDTDDTLGFITDIKYIDNIDMKINFYTMKIYNYIENMVKLKSFQQLFHNYSSKRIDGKPMWEYMKTNTEYNVKPSHDVSLYDFKIDDIITYNYNDWEDNIINIINKLDENPKVDFREQDIIKKYKEQSIYRDKQIYSLPITITVSSGFYVRQLVSDIKEYIQFPILTYDINRLDIKQLI